ncbi:MAG: sulfatase-like hydrolase/transferase [Pirellulaceae bacterium]|nr:sulfatase-like hydrolase/transferase [Pirellulaceae bacterium]
MKTTMSLVIMTAALLAIIESVGATAPARPNIILIMSDDMGYSDTGCYGGEIATPNLDSMARGGVRFTQFYNTARCCPTRASLLTGLYPHQAGIGHMMEDRELEGYRGDLNDRCVTIAEALKPAGYRTYMAGKWHVTKKVRPSSEAEQHNWPLQRGFDRFYGTIHGAGSFFDPNSLTRNNTPISPYADPEYQPDEFYYTDAINDHAVRFIGDHARDHGDQPFFMYVAHTAAHWPMHAKPADIEKYRGKYDTGYDAIRAARVERMRAMGLIDPRWETAPQRGGTWDAVQDREFEIRCMEVYAAMVDCLDQGIGRILNELKRTGQFDNTLVMYFQDNGGCAEGMGRRVGEIQPRADGPTLPPLPDDYLQPDMIPKQTRDGYPVRQGYGVLPGAADTYHGYGEAWANVSNTPFREYKHWVHEGGISTPLIVQWPAGIQAGGANADRFGRLVGDPAHLIDLMATCVDVSGAEYPQQHRGQTIRPMEGVSLLRALTGKPLERPQPIFFEHEGNRAVRDGRWKLVAKGPAGAWELYDMVADRTETHDLAAQQPDRVRQMVRQWEDWANRAQVLPWIWKPAYGEPAPGPAAKKPKPAKKPVAKPQAARPNILWLTAEDLSPHLGCYGDAYARTSVLDRLAAQGVRYTQAFATAPVCSPARSCLITGMYATSLGTQRLRSQFPIPPEIRGFSAYLRQSGYYCSNNVKTDYNLRNEPAFIADAWDESSPRAHWRNKNPGQPFFAVFNFMTTHQSRISVWPHEEFEREIGSKLSPQERHDPAAAPLPPYYPDTAEARRAWARYHDCITKMDHEVGEFLDQLEADGLADDTIVFFYGDHGMGMPRGKRLLHDSGMQVPLIVRFPDKWRHLAPAAAGETTDRLVSFVDFAPTVLSLCGRSVPDHMQGSAFLGSATGEPRRYVYGARDRVDEVFDLSRSVRDGRWLYIRNFMPHLSWMPPERYSDGSTFRREFRRLAAAGQLNADQLTYAAPRRAIEELYDTQADPHQLHNLAERAEHREQLERMQSELIRWMTDSRDAGFLTEPQVWQRIAPNSTPREMARNTMLYPWSDLLRTADLVGRSGALDEQVKLLAHDDDGVRYWAAVGLHAAATAGHLNDPTVRSAVQDRLADPSPVVRIELAAALMALGPNDDALAVLTKDLGHDRPDIVLHAARAAELLGDRARPLLSTMRETLEQARANEQRGDMPMFIRFSLEAALENLP